jgi:zinc finger protein
VEGLFTRAAEDLRALQTERRAADPQQAEALDIFLSRLDALAEGKTAFTLVLDDPSGNSFIENPFAPKPDPLMTTHNYARTDEQNVQIGAMSEETMMQHRDEAGLGSVQEEPSTAGNRNASEGGVSSSMPEREPRYVKAGTRYVAGMVPHGTVGATRMHQAIAEGSSEAVSQALFKYSAPEEVSL